MQSLGARRSAMQARKVEIEQRAEVRAESANEGPVNKLRSKVVEESATFFMR